MKRKAKKADEPSEHCVDIGPHRGFEYKWATPASAKLYFKEGWKRYYRGTGPYRSGFDLLRRPIPKPKKATRKDIQELHGQLTTWLNTHR